MNKKLISYLVLFSILITVTIYFVKGNLVYYPYANYYSSLPNKCTGYVTNFLKHVHTQYPISGKIKLYGASNPQSCPPDAIYCPCDIVRVVSRASFNNNPIPGNSPVISSSGGTLKLIIYFSIRGYLNGTDSNRTSEIVKINYKSMEKG